METEMKVKLPKCYVAQADTVIREAIYVADGLMQVLEEEGKLLSCGKPVDTSALIDRKRKIAGDFESFLERIKAERNLLMHASKDQYPELVQKISSLSRELNSNTAQLMQAMTANERRIETIMRAIREQQTALSPYGSNGQQATRPPMAMSVHMGREA